MTTKAQLRVLLLGVLVTALPPGSVFGGDDKWPQTLAADLLVASDARTGSRFFRAAAPGGVRLPASVRTDPAERARVFLQSTGRSVGLPDASQVTVREVQRGDIVGMDHVRLQQTYRGLPVRGGQLTVHLRGDAVLSVLATTVSDVDSVDTMPKVTPVQAIAAARRAIGSANEAEPLVFTTPQVEIFNRGLLDGAPTASRLAWFTEARGTLLRARIWIDAQSGDLLFNENAAPEALHREIYDLNFDSDKPLPGDLVRFEGDGPTGDVDVDEAYDYSQDTYNYYLTEHGRDSYDGFGAPMIATVHFVSSYCLFPCTSGFWLGNQIVVGPNMTHDDLVGHEWTHGVVEHTAGLIYYKGSGALNEAYCDLFGETIDLTNGRGFDPPGSRWALFEYDVIPGGVRNLMNPTLVGSRRGPGKMTDPEFRCTAQDSGAVHTNSAVGTHAYALMVDGGTYNGFSISGIGLTKAAQIHYRALTLYLTPPSGYPEQYQAVQQACADLIGTFGITAGDCDEVKKALDAVEMFVPFPCDCGNGIPDPNEQCDDGNQNDGDCCSATCFFEPSGAPCTDGNECTDDHCDGAGTCLVVSNTNPTCDDGHVCTSGDTCIAGECVGTAQPRMDCRAPTAAGKARLVIKDDPFDEGDQVQFSWSKGAQTDKNEFGDPRTATDYTLCVYDYAAGVPQVALELAVPAGGVCADAAPCWRQNRNGFAYRDRGRSHRGLQAIRLREGLSGKARITLKAKGPLVLPPGLPLTQSPRVTAQIVRDSSGLCWDADFAASDSRNESDSFRATGQ